jgi:hypothetical protein
MKQLLFRVWNFWPPFWGAGIKVDFIARDYQTVRMRLKRRPWTKNIVGTQYGGSIYSMTDPIYMVMFLVLLGRDYIVWDKAATIRFRKPGRSDLTAEFCITSEDLTNIRQRLRAVESIDWHTDVWVKDSSGEVVAEVHKIVHIRNKRFAANSPVTESESSTVSG